MVEISIPCARPSWDQYEEFEPCTLSDSWNEEELLLSVTPCTLDGNRIIKLHSAFLCFHFQDCFSVDTSPDTLCLQNDRSVICCSQSLGS